MSHALRASSMTQAEFFAFADGQEMRYEFDGFVPVAMTGGSIPHSRIIANISFALRSRLHGTGCIPMGPDAGISTVGDTIRYPDVLVSRDRTAAGSRLATNVTAVFEVISPGSVSLDRVVKPREYFAVPSISTYVIVEQDRMAITVRDRDGQVWRANDLGGSGTLLLSVPDVAVPVAEFYDGIDF